jgi:hypothetical protein
LYQGTALAVPQSSLHDPALAAAVRLLLDPIVLKGFKAAEARARFLTDIAGAGL